jgi:protein-S-isoprenylcysteine O-methyltransferase Ste14
MSEPLRPTTRLKIFVPVAFLFGYFAFYVLAIFLAGSTPLRVLCALVSFIGCVLWIIARMQLGNAALENRLVTSGLYGEVRHPIYYASTLAFLGFSIFILIWTPLILVPLAALVIFQIIRIRREEKALASKLGRRYLRYKERTLL